MSTGDTGKRTRRTPEAARDVILAAAQRRLEAHGLEGLNVVDVAAAAGLSHATLIHHFGSADGMRQALAARMSSRLVRDLMAALDRDVTPGKLFEGLFAALSSGGHARLLAWTAVAENERFAPTPASEALFEALMRACAARLPEHGLDQARNVVLLVAAAAIGLGVAGNALPRLIGMDDDAVAAFPEWLARQPFDG